MERHNLAEGQEIVQRSPLWKIIVRGLQVLALGSFPLPFKTSHRFTAGGSRVLRAD